jgi:hypothetical protein
VAPALAAPLHFPAPARVRRQALRDVERRLRRAEPPPGAKALATAPKGSHLSLVGEGVNSKNFLDRSRFWVVPGSPAETLAWIKAHPPGGLSPGFEGYAQDGGRTVELEVGFEAKPLRGLATDRTLFFATARAPDGRTILRVDAQGVWVLPHLATEVIPPSASSLEVVREPPGGTATTQRVTDRAAVRRLAGLIDRLPVEQPYGHVECGLQIGEGPLEVTLIFRDTSGTAVAEAHQQVPEGLCSAMELTIEGERQRPLAGGGAMLAKQLPRLP